MTLVGYFRAKLGSTGHSQHALLRLDLGGSALLLCCYLEAHRSKYTVAETARQAAENRYRGFVLTALLHLPHWTPACCKE